MIPCISNFLEEIASLSHSIVFLYFLSMITEEGFLISPCYSLELCIQMAISFLFSFAFTSLLFSAICKAHISFRYTVQLYTHTRICMYILFQILFPYML